METKIEDIELSPIEDPNMDINLVNITEKLDQYTGTSPEKAIKYDPLPVGEGIQGFCNNYVTKKIIREGTGEVPLPQSSVTVHYVGRLYSDGTVFEDSRKGKPFTYDIGAKVVIQGWDIVVPTMKKGEIAEITLSPSFAYSDLGNGSTIPPHAIVVFEIELLDWEPIRKNIGPGVEKAFAVRGEGWEVPILPSICTVKIEGRIRDENGPVYLKIDDYVDIDLDDPDIPEGLETALLSMKPSEVSYFWIDYMVSGHGLFPEKHLISIPEGSNLWYRLELKSFTTNTPVWEMGLDEKVQVGFTIKESGNKLYKAGNYKRALDRYTQAASMFEFEVDTKGDHKKAIYDIVIACHSNVAAVKLKVGAYQEVVEACDKVLAVDPHHMKTLYRKAQAFAYLQMHEEALNVLLFADDIPAPEHVKADITRALSSIRTKYEKDIQKEKLRWKRATQKH